MKKSWHDKSLKEIFSGNKKSYNPFKMWGSYAGAILGLLIIPLFGKFQLCLFTFTCSNSLGMFDTGRLMSGIFYGMLILGFLIGWGIHSLVRKVRG